MHKYNEIIKMFPKTEIDSALKKMIENFDLSGNYFPVSKKSYYNLSSEEFLKQYFNITPNLSNTIKLYARKECEDDLKRCRESKTISWEYFEISKNYDLSTPDEQYIKVKIDRIYSSIWDYFISQVKEITKDRSHLRIPVGGHIEFNECLIVKKHKNYVEFFKDGAWGIANPNGTVLVKNHICKQPSEIRPPSVINNTFIKSYRIIQDRDTKKYGLLSVEYLYETVLCLYDELEFIENSIYNTFIIIAKKDGKWGCFNERCALIITFKYDIIQLKNNFLECIKDAQYIENETLAYNANQYVVEGKKYLYDNDGILLLGGYDELIIEYDYMKFYFGTFYECYQDFETDFYGYSCALTKARLNFEKSKCLILDTNFKTLINGKNGIFTMPKGCEFNTIAELEKTVPHDLLLNFEVDLSLLYRNFICLHSYYGEQYFIPQFIIEGNMPIEEIHLIEKQDDIFDILTNNIDDKQDCYEETKDIYIEDSVVIIVKLNKDNTINSYHKVNEISSALHTKLYYRLRDKIGIFDGAELQPAIFDAITYLSPETYVASIEYYHPSKHNLSVKDNHNFNPQPPYFIRFFKLTDEGPIRMSDDWSVFNPRKYKWFPYDFSDKIPFNSKYETETYESCVLFDDSYEWSDEDSWDAMTDGKYGDYPGPNWDPELFGF